MVNLPPVTVVSVAAYRSDALPQAAWSCKTRGPLTRCPRRPLVTGVVPSPLVCSSLLLIRINKGRACSGQFRLPCSCFCFFEPLPFCFFFLASFPLVLVSKASFPASSIRESRLRNLEKKGFIPPMDVSGWRLESEGEIIVIMMRWLCPCPSTNMGSGSSFVPLYVGSFTTTS